MGSSSGSNPQTQQQHSQSDLQGAERIPATGGECVCVCVHVCARADCEKLVSLSAKNFFAFWHTTWGTNILFLPVFLTCKVAAVILLL